MPNVCQICQSEQRRIRVDDDLRIGLEASVIATRNRVPRSDIIEHWRQCLGNVALRKRIDSEQAPIASGEHIVTNNPYTQFMQAWHDAKDDERMRQRMVDFINQQLMEDDMGL